MYNIYGVFKMHTVYLLVRDQNNYLMIQDSQCLWSFPFIRTSSNKYTEELNMIQKMLNFSIKENALIKVIDQKSDNAILLCTSWNNKPRIDNTTNILGLGWFTISQIYNMGEAVNAITNNILNQVAFIFRHEFKLREGEK